MTAICGDAIVNGDSVSQAALAIVSLQAGECRTVKGVLHSLYMARDISFTGIDQLLLILDDIMEAADCPQSPSLRRSINKTDNFFEFLNTAELIQMHEEAKNYYGYEGKTVVIHVQFRQHSSMQGTLRTAQGNAYFRSGMELMRMLYEYLDA